MGMGTVKVICVGDATQDNFLFLNEANLNCDINKEECVIGFNYGDKIPVEEAEVAVGGNAANVAAGLVKLGIGTKLVTEFGDDERGAFLKRELLRAGVDLENSRTVADRKSNLSAVVVFKGERTILSYHAPKEEKVLELPESEWIYVTSAAGRDSRGIFERAVEHPGKIGFNPAKSDLLLGKDHLTKILARTEVIFLNREEAEILGGEKEVSKLGKVISNLGPKTVAITDGKNGADVFKGEESYHSPIANFPLVEATGAGDGFTSGFLASLILNGEDLKTALLWGVVNSGSVVAKVGAWAGQLTTDEITRYLENNSLTVNE